MLMIWPPAWRRKWGSAALTVRAMPHRLVSNMLWADSSGMLSADPATEKPALLMSTSNFPCSSTTLAARVLIFP
jgi:hypothetical protein